MRNRDIWRILLLTVVIGLGTPAAFGWLSSQASNPLLVLGFVGLPFLIWPGYLLWLTLWACKNIRWRWFLPPLFTVLLAATSGLWAGWLYPVFIAIDVVMLVLSVLVMILMPSSGVEQKGEKHEA